VARIVLVRHGEASAPFTESPDPGLSATGREQAARLVDQLGGRDGRMLRTSPLRRARETAEPVERAWEMSARVDDRVSEIPWTGDDLAARGSFLRRALRARWSDLSADYQTWRDSVVEALAHLDHDAVVFTHLIVINVVIGRAAADDRVVILPVANCSQTVIETSEGVISTVEPGEPMA
jgi:broad specificity phosphatase PhoE